MALETGAITAQVDDAGFGVEFLTPNRGGDETMRRPYTEEEELAADLSPALPVRCRGQKAANQV
jgi:hypothetical protein